MKENPYAYHIAIKIDLREMLITNVFDESLKENVEVDDKSDDENEIRSESSDSDV